MIKKHYKDVKEEIVTKANSTKTTIRWLITKQDGSPKFSTRRFEIQPGGQIGVHNHPEDHHFYILEGQGKFLDDEGKAINVKPGDSVYMPSNQPHGVINEANTTLIFICVIPNL